MQAKIFQFDEVLRHEISTSSLAMYPNEIKALEEAFIDLSQITSTPPRRPSTPLTSAHVDDIISILDRWPSSQRFPVIDLSRLLLGFFPEAFNEEGIKDRFADALFRAADWNASWALPLPKPRETNMLLLFRTLCNAFQDDGQTDSVWLTKVLGTLTEAPYTSLNKTQRVALATIVFNVSCQGLRFALGSSLRDRAVSLINKILESETEDSEAVYRALVALGNIVHNAKTINSPLSANQKGEVTQCLQTLPGTFPDARVRNICVEIGALI